MSKGFGNISYIVLRHGDNWPLELFEGTFATLDHFIVANFLKHRPSIDNLIVEELDISVDKGETTRYNASRWLNKMHGVQGE